MPKKIALLIGVREYGAGIPSLSAPLNDVTAIKRVLANPHMGAFDQVEQLIDPDLTAMQTAVQQIFANCGKDDLVLLFFSGHGITDDNNRLYFATKGTSKDFYKATSVPASFIQDISLECYAKRQAIILDCCYSGAFAEGWQTKSIGVDLKKELGAVGRVVLTSSSATQTSFQQEGEELSLYTKYFVEGIETGAADQDANGKIYAHELHNYAKNKVQEVKPKQKPEIITDKEGYHILLSQSLVDNPKDFRKVHDQRAHNKRPIPSVDTSKPLKNRVLFCGGIAVTSAFILIFFLTVIKPSPPINVCEKNSTTTSQMTAKDFLDCGNNLSDQEKYQAAIGAFTQAIKLKPYFSLAYYNRGNIFRQLRDYQAAVEDYTEAINIDQNWGIVSKYYFQLPSAYHNRGLAHYYQGNNNRAIEDYTKAIKLKNDNPETYYQRSLAHYYQGNNNRAIGDLTQAINLKSDYADAYYSRGVGYYSMQDYQKALVDFTQAAELYKKQGNKTEWYQKALNKIKELQK